VATLLGFPLGPGSGLGVYVLGLMEALRANPRLELLLIAPNKVRGAAGRRGSQALLMVEQLLALRRARPEVIHTHDHPALLAAAIGYQQLADPSVRVVYTTHFDPVDRRALWKRALLGWLLARCAAVTVVAENSVQKLELIARPAPARHQVQIVRGAATMRARDKNDPAVLAFAESIGHRTGPVLLQVSNFWFPAKVEGTLRLIEAMIHVRERFPSARLVLVGTGPLLRKALDLRERLGLADSVTVPGTFIDDLSVAVGLADIHCHISLQDACPISILEAMHAGKPVVASRTAGIPEIIEDGVNGRLVVNEPAQIAAALVELLEHPADAAAMGLRAQAVARSRFTWERVADDFEELYRAAPSNPDVACEVI
jgi:glycosyltransferase involved in cell wall biosynthesis